MATKKKTTRKKATRKRATAKGAAAKRKPIEPPEIHRDLLQRLVLIECGLEDMARFFGMDVPAFRGAVAADPELRRVVDRAKGGRTKGERGYEGIEIDIEQLRRLSRIGTSQADIADYFEMTERQFERRIADDESLAIVQRRAKAEMRRNLRRVLYRAALLAGQPGAPPGAMQALIKLAQQPEKNGGLGMFTREITQHELNEHDGETLRMMLTEKFDAISGAR